MGATAWSAGVGGKFASSAVGTIAFGALSGGVGAEMAGGNFWQGAVTGGIVAGLNHAMHKMDEAFAKGKLDREVDVAYGNLADSEAPATDATLEKMKNTLPTLKKLYPSTGNRGMYANADMDTAYDGVSIAKTFAYDTDGYKSSTTTYFKDSFKSYRILARTMLHEFGHGVHYFNGEFNKYRKNHTTAQTDSWKERYAFNFAFVNGGVPYKNDPWYIINSK